MGPPGSSIVPTRSPNFGAIHPGSAYITSMNMKASSSLQFPLVAHLSFLAFPNQAFVRCGHPQFVFHPSKQAFSLHPPSPSSIHSPLSPSPLSVLPNLTLPGHHSKRLTFPLCPMNPLLALCPQVITKNEEATFLLTSSLPPYLQVFCITPVSNPCYKARGFPVTYPCTFSLPWDATNTNKLSRPLP